MTQLETHYQKALADIGPIVPWWSEADNAYVFEHAAYPYVDYVGPTPELVIENYQRVLRAFVEARLAGELAEPVDWATSGRGGKRPGAGRPKGSKKAPTTRITVPSALAVILKRYEGCAFEVQESGASAQVRFLRRNINERI